MSRVGNRSYIRTQLKGLMMAFARYQESLPEDLSDIPEPTGEEMIFDGIHKLLREHKVPGEEAAEWYEEGKVIPWEERLNS